MHYGWSMAYMILGLLYTASMSLYDLMQVFKASVSLFYGSSAGSIKPALDKLVRQGYAVISRQEPGVRGRREYTITESGKEAFTEWMHSEIPGNSDAIAVARLFFLGILPAAEREIVLKRIIDRAQQELAQLEAKQEEAAEDDIFDGLADVAHYRIAALNYGVASARHAYQWFAALYAEETGKNHH